MANVWFLVVKIYFRMILFNLSLALMCLSQASFQCGEEVACTKMWISTGRWAAGRGQHEESPEASASKKVQTRGCFISVSYNVAEFEQIFICLTQGCICQRQTSPAADESGTLSRKTERLSLIVVFSVFLRLACLV